MKKGYLHILLFMWPVIGMSQATDSTEVQQEAVQVSSNMDAPLIVDRPTQEKKDTLSVTPWKTTPSIGFSTFANDSSLRWQVWPNWGDYFAYRMDAISFRQGTNGRLDAYHINGYKPHEQQVSMEGVYLNNPITGTVNYNLVPHRKILNAYESFEGSYYSKIKLRDYYLTKPISYLNYDESEQAYRNLEFMVTQNFTDATNLELSYWDRRGGGYYPNSEMEGSQILVRAYHHLSETYLIRAMYLRNQLKNEEPLGYNVGDPATFAFDEFNSIPNSSNAESSFTRWDLVTGIYHRSDSSKAEDSGLEFTISKNSKSLTITGDTLTWDLRSLYAQAFKRWQGNRWELKLTSSADHHMTTGRTDLNLDNWFNIKGQVDVGYSLNKNLEWYGKGKVIQRNDPRTGFEWTSGVKASVREKFNAEAGFSMFERIPTIQAMYWDSRNYSGNARLSNEIGWTVMGKLQYNPWHQLSIGLTGRYLSAENSPAVITDSTFVNNQPYDQISGTLFGRFQNQLFEIESAATLQNFQYQAVNSLPDNQLDQILWLRNNFFVKGYVFDRAAYLKFGVKTLLSPFYYYSRTFNAELDYWQPGSTYQEIPSFFRLDGELSARVRGIMIVMRWENALDGLGQAGYFEAAGFPMPPRRLIVGIRAQFRN